MNGPRSAQTFDTESEQLLLGQAGPTGCSSTEVDRGSEGVCLDGSTCLSWRMIKENGIQAARPCCTRTDMDKAQRLLGLCILDGL